MRVFAASITSATRVAGAIPHTRALSLGSTDGEQYDYTNFNDVPPESLDYFRTADEVARRSLSPSYTFMSDLFFKYYSAVQEPTYVNTFSLAANTYLSLYPEIADSSRGAPKIVTIGGFLADLDIRMALLDTEPRVLNVIPKVDNPFVLSIKNAQIASAGVPNLKTTMMSLDDMSSVPDMFCPADLVTVQFAITDLYPGALREIQKLLRDGGILVGTHWIMEDFALDSVWKATIAGVLDGDENYHVEFEEVPSIEELEEALSHEGFKTIGRHGEIVQPVLNMGNFDDITTILACLFPVLPAIMHVHGGDNFPIEEAIKHARKAIINEGIVDSSNDVVIRTAKYCYFVAQKK